jgi:hypothetical protein
MFSTKDDAFSLVTTATIKLSMPAKFPWLSRAGAAIKILKLARGAILVTSLLDGTKYGSPGKIFTLFARSVGLGKANVDHTPGFAKSVASVLLSVVIAAGISRPMS